MNIIILGANGFIGSHIAYALQKAGHNIIYGVRQKNINGSKNQQLICDFSIDTQTAIWVKRLQEIQKTQNIDMVINAVGILRDSKQKPMHAIHTQTPCALFNACVEVGIQRVMHISALGIEQSNTLYANTKKTTDAHLLQLAQNNKLQAVIMRPSVVFGFGGDSSNLFIQLSKLPILLLPKAMLTTHIQPISVFDLATAIQNICTHTILTENIHNNIVECVGPESLSFAQFIATLREQTGKKAPKFITMPDWLTQASAKIGDYIPNIPWCSEALSLMQAQNTSTSNAFAKILGRSPIHHQEFLSRYIQNIN
jgi:nucleoside-diphosphate-sugar epimerase